MKVRDYKKVYITAKGERAALLGHPWVYEGEVTKTDDITDGELVDVISPKDKYIGTGFYNSNSKIRVRIISRNTNDTYDAAFFKRRIQYAWNFRKTTMPNDLNAVRVIFGEADGFPGLTVDKFNDILVVQILSLGIEMRKDIILKALYEVLTEDGYAIKGIYERNDVSIRKLEGMEMGKGWFDIGLPLPDKTTTEIVENGLKYIVDFENGQKTGYFLDQKYNRLLIRNIAKDKTVLDCCTHTGSFAMNALLGGAKEVTAMDISDKAIEDSITNFKLNNMDIKTKVGDVFDVLKELQESKTKYDFIILDPPAFTKSRKTIISAMKGYTELNFLALKCISRGGYFATASCSHFASEEEFKKAIFNAACEAGVQLKQVSFSGPSPDHPELWGVDETKYLNFYIFQVI